MKTAGNAKAAANHRPKRIVVVGAGMAGVKLAYDCLQHDPYVHVTIVEANDYIGGRIRNCSFQGHTVEMGANWISGLETAYLNPVWKLAKDVNLKGHIVDRSIDATSLSAMDEKGNNIIHEYLQSMNKFELIYDECVKECKNRGITPQTDVDIRTLLEELGWVDDVLTATDKLVEYNLLEVWLTDGLEKTSVAHNFEPGANDVELGKDEFFVEDPRGFNCILGHMVDAIQSKSGRGNILLSSRAKKIDYSGDGVTITIQNLGTGEKKELQADVAVCTVSLGVLQADLIEFLPPLPNWKRNALNEMQMYLFSKVFVKLHKQLVEMIQKNQVTFCTNKKGYYPLWMKYRNTIDDNEDVFMCYIGGKEAQRVELLSTEEIKDEIETLLRNTFHNITERQLDNTNNGKASIFRPIDVHVTDWSKNLNFCGSYSVYPVHAFATIPHDHLRKGLSSMSQEQQETDAVHPVKLYFAGEAFDDKFNGWVQGAYRSGERVAKQVMGLYS